MVEIQFKDKMGSNCNSNSIIVVDYNINNKNNGNNTIKVIGGWNSGSYNIVISSWKIYHMCLGKIAFVLSM